MDDDERHVMTAEEIGLVRAVARWLRADGVDFFRWPPNAGGPFAEWKRLGEASVSYDVRSRTLLFTRNYLNDSFTEIPARTVGEAVDLLVALGFLPPEFSMAYRYGWDNALYCETVAPSAGTVPVR